jgi:hypothetical protein
MYGNLLFGGEVKQASDFVPKMKERMKRYESLEHDFWNCDETTQIIRVSERIDCCMDPDGYCKTSTTCTHPSPYSGGQRGTVAKPKQPAKTITQLDAECQAADARFTL